MSLRFDTADPDEREPRASTPPPARRAAATSSCCRPTPSTAWAATPSTRAASPAARRPRAAAATCRCRCSSAPGHPRGARPTACRRPRATSSRRSGPAPLTVVVRHAAEPRLGPRRRERHRRPADAAAPGGPRAARATGPDGGDAAPTAPAPRPPTDYAEAEEQLGDSVAVYLDAGPRPTRRPSTIVDVTGPVPAAAAPRRGRPRHPPHGLPGDRSRLTGTARRVRPRTP